MRRPRTKTPWQRRRRRALIVLSAVGLLITSWLVWRLQLKAEVRESMDALRAAGVPATEAERQAWLATFPAATPTDLYANARAGYVPLPLDMVDDLPTFRPRHEEAALHTTPYPPEVLTAMRSALETNEAALAFLQEATELPTGHYTDTGRFRDELLELYCAEACVHAADGDGEGAVSAITGGLLYLERTAAPHEGPPRWPPQHLERLLVALFSAASQVELPDPGLRVIHDRMDSAGWEEQQRLAGIDWMNRVLVDRAEFELPIEFVAWNIALGSMDRQLLRQVEAWRYSQEQIGKSMAEQEADNSAKSDRGRHGLHRPKAPPMILEVARTGINIIRFHQTTGALPASLEELVPEYCQTVPQDFFSAAPLGYTVEGTAFAVYSVDRDKKDDGGSGRSDIVFRSMPKGIEDV